MLDSCFSFSKPRNRLKFQAAALSGDRLGLYRDLQKMIQIVILLLKHNRWLNRRGR